MGTIYAELRQERPYERREEELLVTLLRTADVLRHALERGLEPSGLSLEQYNVLRILRGAPRGCQTLEIATRMVSRSPNITRLIDKLIAKDLVQRERSARDRRCAVVKLTAAGARQLTSVAAAFDELLDDLGALPARERAATIDLLDAIRARCAIATARQRASGRAGRG
jgi:DNA-binding MarR family transcriptional regulator